VNDRAPWDCPQSRRSRRRGRGSAALLPARTARPPGVGGDVDQPVAQRARQAGAIGPPGAPQRRLVLHPQPHALVRAHRRADRGCGARTVKRKGKRHGRAAALTRGSEDLAMQCSDLVRNKAGTPARRLHGARRGGRNCGMEGRGKGIDSVGNRFMFHYVLIFSDSQSPLRPNKEEAAPSARNRPDQSLTSIPPRQRRHRLRRNVGIVLVHVDHPAPDMAVIAAVEEIDHQADHRPAGEQQLAYSPTG
jgi:hypothetical protein